MNSGSLPGFIGQVFIFAGEKISKTGLYNTTGSEFIGTGCLKGGESPC